MSSGPSLRGHWSRRTSPRLVGSLGSDARVGTSTTFAPAHHRRTRKRRGLLSCAPMRARSATWEC
eukprot:3611485-Alexandrium_andersonii.AAC.1